MVMDLGDWGVVMVVGSVELCARVDEWVHFCTHTEGVEVGEVQSVVLSGGCVE